MAYRGGDSERKRERIKIKGKLGLDLSTRAVFETSEVRSKGGGGGGGKVARGYRFIQPQHILMSLKSEWGKKICHL